VPEVSVIVPARNASATLGATLAALAAQDFAGEYEVVVVDNASHDPTPEIAERAPGVRLLRNARDLGAAGSRDRGARESASAVLAFTDADCEPAPDWLTRGVAALAHADLVQGAVRPTPGVVVGPWDRTVTVADETGLFETANLLIRREAYERAGGFPSFLDGTGPGLRPKVGEAPFGEDTLFGWRARAAGARIAFAPDALVHHAVFPRDAAGHLRERTRMRFFPALIRAAPGLDARLTHRIFLSRRTAAFDAALAGVATALATRRLLPLLAALPYARLLNRSRRTAAVDLAADAITCAALARGSVAARKPVL